MASLAAVGSWDREVDVVVVGSGMAGTVTAIEAYDTDPSAAILIVEKMPEGLAGGSGRCAGGFVYAPDPEDIEDLKTYHRALNGPNPAPEDVVEAWAQAVVHQRPWLERVVTEAGRRLLPQPDAPPDFPDLPGSAACEKIFTVEEHDGVAINREGGVWVRDSDNPLDGENKIWGSFMEHVRRRGIPILHDTPVVDLVQDPDSLEVFGVLAESDGARIAIKARRGVILCCGGYAANPEIQLNYCGYPKVTPLGGPGSTGDGIHMLQKAGAKLWHMSNFGHVGGIFPAIRAPEMASGFMREFLAKTSWIDIGADDGRFYDETAKEYYQNHYKVHRSGNWVDPPFIEAQPIHMIFDEETRLGGKLIQDWTGWNMVAMRHQWSADNGAEVEKGWIVKADSIRELAELIGRDPDAVEATVRRYNEACAAGSDPDFGRDPESLTPIASPPYYAVEVVPGMAGTPGGGQRTPDAGVMSTAGAPIPRLYEAGELGSTFADRYQNGSYITEAIAFGRIAGRNAASRSSWDGAAA